MKGVQKNMLHLKASTSVLACHQGQLSYGWVILTIYQQNRDNSPPRQLVTVCILICCIFSKSRQGRESRWAFLDLFLGVNILLSHLDCSVSMAVMFVRSPKELLMPVILLTAVWSCSWDCWRSGCWLVNPNSFGGGEWDLLGLWASSGGQVENSSGDGRTLLWFPSSSSPDGELSSLGNTLSLSSNNFMSQGSWSLSELNSLWVKSDHFLFSVPPRSKSFLRLISSSSSSELWFPVSESCFMSVETSDPPDPFFISRLLFPPARAGLGNLSDGPPDSESENAILLL